MYIRQLVTILYLAIWCDLLQLIQSKMIGKFRKFNINQLYLFRMARSF